jgi:capsular polysaccharide biosynthesis protein
VKKRLFASPSADDLITLLQAWRFWLLSGLVGALLGGLFYAVFPPDYRARATVVVDFNMEEAWPVDSDRELFYYLEREARKLEEVAKSDEVLEEVANKTGNITVDELRAGVLELSEPADGGWHFYANDPSPEHSEELASAWAQAFTEKTQEGIENAVALDAARKALEAKPTDETLLARVSVLESNSLGITPEIQVSLAQAKNLQAARQTGAGYYVLVGAVSFMALSALGVLLFGKISRA